jgi:hypothetical protein
MALKSFIRGSLSKAKESDKLKQVFALNDNQIGEENNVYNTIT